MHPKDIQRLQEISDISGILVEIDGKDFGSIDFTCIRCGTDKKSARSGVTCKVYGHPYKTHLWVKIGEDGLDIEKVLNKEMLL